MGSAASVAAGKADQEQEQLTRLLTILRNRLALQIDMVEKARGSADAVIRTQVAGGRSVMRMTQVRVAESTDVANEIKSAISDFFSAAQKGIDKDDKGAQHAAVRGAQNLLVGGLRALLGVSHGREMEKTSFVVLFLNNAFVRVDYYIYTYNVSAEKWGAEANSAGSCYVADMSVLDMATLHPGEIDFLLSQALAITPQQVPYLNFMKVKLMESSILGQMMLEPQHDLKAIEQIASSWHEVNSTLQQAYKGISA